MKAQVKTLDAQSAGEVELSDAPERADLLAKLGRNDEARAAFMSAAALAQNTRERDLLLARANACQAKGSA